MDWRQVRRAEYNSARYRRNRALVIARDKVCQPCKREGRPAAIYEVDHIVSIREWYSSGRPAHECSGLANLQGICLDCHRRKTAEESEVVRRARYPRFDARGRRVG